MKKLHMLPKVIVLDEINTLCPELTKELLKDLKKSLKLKPVKYDFSFTRDSLV